MVCSDAEDASDNFTRIETVPCEKVLPILQKQKNCSTAKQWVEHINTLPLGPNIISFLGHGDLRVATKGLTRTTDLSISPTETEMQEIETQLKGTLTLAF